MPINQGALPSCPDYNYVVNKDAPKDRKIIIFITEGEFEDVAFNLFDMRFVEAEENAVFQFDYDIVDLEGITTEASLAKVEKNPDVFEEVVCSVVNSILIDSMEHNNGLLFS
jgi:hypothetical protein